MGDLGFRRQRSGKQEREGGVGRHTFVRRKSPEPEEKSAKRRRNHDEAGLGKVEVGKKRKREKGGRREKRI